MNTKYQMWLTFNAEKEKIQFPVLPENITVAMGSNDESVNVVDLGEILIAQGRPATTISFSSFFPATKFPGIAVENITDPKILCDKIEKWKESTKPVHFIVTGRNTDMYCRIANFVATESGGDTGTINFDITLKEHRDPKVRKIEVSETTQTATISKDTARTDNSTIPSTYTVKKGDCLWNIAKRFFGTGTAHSQIYNANKSVIGSNPNLIKPGMVLNLSAVKLPTK